MINDHALDTLFREARTHRNWQEKDVSDALLQAAYELAKFGPTASNSQPMRVIFLKSRAAKEKIKPALDTGNHERAMTAPVIAVIAYARLDGKTDEYLLRNSSLSGAYMIMAARAVGLDCLPMSGFDNAKVDALFFADGKHKSNFLLALGYGDTAKLQQPRKPRLSFDEACQIL